MGNMCNNAIPDTVRESLKVFCGPGSIECPVFTGTGACLEGVSIELKAFDVNKLELFPHALVHELVEMPVAT